MGEETRKTKLRATPPHRHYDYRVFRVQKSEAHGGGGGASLDSHSSAADSPELQQAAVGGDRPSPEALGKFQEV